MDEQGLLDSAVLLMAMGEDSAAQVFRHLSPKEIEKLSQTMAGLKSMPRGRVDEVLARFEQEAGEHGSLVPDTGGYVKAVLNRALGPEKAGMLAGRILPTPPADGIETLKWMEPASISDMLRSEHPQVIASILAHLERDVASAALASMDESLRANVMLRIATLDSIRPQAMADLNEALTRILQHVPQARANALGGAKAAAEILNSIGSPMEASLLEKIRETDPELAQQISDLMLVFDDLLDLDDRSIQTVLREVQNDQLIVALKGASTELREKIFKNMSLRAAETLREDLDGKGPVRLSEVEAQQKEIMDIVRRLVEEGQVQIVRAGSNAFV